MNRQEFLKLIQKGESDTLEFKSSFSKAVIETIVAFSNTKGGKVILGVNDQKEIVGLSFNKESIQRWINEIKQNTSPAILPDISSETIEGKNILILSVNEFPIKPVFYKDKSYSR